MVEGAEEGEVMSSLRSERQDLLPGVSFDSLLRHHPSSFSDAQPAAESPTSTFSKERVRFDEGSRKNNEPDTLSSDRFETQQLQPFSR